MELIIILMCLALCGSGLILIFAKDTAWQWALWSNSARGLRAQRMERTPQWDTFATVRGVLVVAASLILLFTVLAAGPGRRLGQRTDTPRVGQTSYTVDGRPATPGEQQVFQHWGDGNTAQPTSSGH